MTTREKAETVLVTTVSRCPSVSLEYPETPVNRCPGVPPPFREGTRGHPNSGDDVQRAASGMFAVLVLVVLLLMLVGVTPASAQDRRTPVALGAYMTAGYWDAASTAFCSGAKSCHEVNPFLAPIVDRRGVVPAMAVKGALHVGIAAWLLHDRHQHPKRAFWTAVGLTAAQMAVNVGNARRLKRGE